MRVITGPDSNCQLGLNQPASPSGWLAGRQARRSRRGAVGPLHSRGLSRSGRSYAWRGRPSQAGF